MLLDLYQYVYFSLVLLDENATIVATTVQEHSCFNKIDCSFNKNY